MQQMVVRCQSKNITERGLPGHYTPAQPIQCISSLRVVCGLTSAFADQIVYTAEGNLQFY